MATTVITDLSTALASPGAIVQPASQAATDTAGVSISFQGQKGNGAGAGSDWTMTAGAGGTTGAGGAYSIAGGQGGSTSGTGGPVNITGGAGVAGNANGAAVNILSGANNGSGTAGAVNIDCASPGAGTAGAINIGTSYAAKVKIYKPIDVSVGGSTAAAGANSGAATVLPAGTASVYPTTAADDSAGVRAHASDQVTGRILFIGNGVSNKILKVYPVTGGSINGGSVDAAFSSASGKGVVLVCLSSGANTWLAW